MNTSALIKSEAHRDLLFRSALERIQQLEAQLQSVLQLQTKSETLVRIYQSNRIITASPSDILYIQAEDNYSRIFLKSGVQYYVSRTLKSWSDELSSTEFIRCHRTYLINRKEAEEVNRRTHEVILRNGVRIPTSRRFQKSCLNSLFPSMKSGMNIQSVAKVHQLHVGASSPGK